MSGEDHSLPVKLEKLEIRTGKPKAKTASGDENPFQKTAGASGRSAISLWGRRCGCFYKKDKKGSIHSKVPFKRTSGKLLKDPILKYASWSCQNVSKADDLANSLSTVSLSPPDPCNIGSCKLREIQLSNSQFELTSPIQHDFRSLVGDECNQLNISKGLHFNSKSFQNVQCRNNNNNNNNVDANCEPQVSASGATSERSRGVPSCSQQALNPPCDVTIDELACYFETLVHIPKKMSTMAEMMYI